MHVDGCVLSAAGRDVCDGMPFAVCAAAWRLGAWGRGVVFAAGCYVSITYLLDLSIDVLNNTTSTAAKERAKEAKSEKKA